MKIKLTCPCGESFNIRAENFKNKTQIVCPNCDKKFPEEKFDDFKKSIITLDKIKNDIETQAESSGFTEPHWKFEF